MHSFRPDGVAETPTSLVDGGIFLLLFFRGRKRGRVNACTFRGVSAISCRKKKCYKYNNQSAENIQSIKRW